jgi:Periplasmic lysozyme inhibitor of I-type lysozyme
MKTISASAVLLSIGLAHGAEGNLRFVKKFQIPNAVEVIVVAEGDFEARSIGSYALRVYGGSSKKFPTDDFVAGLIRPRNGTIDALRFDDVDGDGRPDIVVIVRSVGSGGSISADAFRYRTKSLEFIGSVSDLDKRADPIQDLRKKIKASDRGKS